MDDTGHCLALLRAHDRDIYLASLLLPPGCRRSVIALHAFSTEIARVRDIVSEPLPGEIRLQWWRDAISSGGSGGARGNPVANALLEAIETHDLPREAFERMLLARAFDLYDDPMPSLVDLEGYTGETVSALFQLAALAAGAKPSPALADCSGHAGVAFATMRLLCGLARDASRGKLYLPADILEKTGARAEAILRGEHHDGLERAVGEMIVLSRAHREKALEALLDLPKEVRPVFLPLSLVEPYLRKLEKTGFDPLRHRVFLAQWRVQWALWRGM